MLALPWWAMPLVLWRTCPRVTHYRSCGSTNAAGHGPWCHQRLSDGCSSFAWTGPQSTSRSRLTPTCADPCSQATVSSGFNFTNFISSDPSYSFNLALDLQTHASHKLGKREALGHGEMTARCGTTAQVCCLFYSRLAHPITNISCLQAWQAVYTAGTILPVLYSRSTVYCQYYTAAVQYTASAILPQYSQ